MFKVRKGVKYILESTVEFQKIFSDFFELAF